MPAELQGLARVQEVLVLEKEEREEEEEEKKDEERKRERETRGGRFSCLFMFVLLKEKNSVFSVSNNLIFFIYHIKEVALQQ